LVYNYHGTQSSFFLNTNQLMLFSLSFWESYRTRKCTLWAKCRVRS